MALFSSENITKHKIKELDIDKDTHYLINRKKRVLFCFVRNWVPNLNHTTLPTQRNTQERTTSTERKEQHP